MQQVRSRAGTRMPDFLCLRASLAIWVGAARDGAGGRYDLVWLEAPSGTAPNSLTHSFFRHRLSTYCRFSEEVTYTKCPADGFLFLWALGFLEGITQ